MSKKAFELRLAEIEALVDAPPELAEAGLAKALANRNQLIVAKAARVAARMGLKSLLPQIAQVAAHSFSLPASSDPQCWGKNALIEALVELGFDEVEIYLRGTRHIQPEPVYGGSEDSAGPLRALCAQALANCTRMADLDLLRELVPLLVDPQREVRIAAAQLSGQVGRPEAALLLRLKSLAGDADPEVLGAGLTALLAIEGAAGLDFVAGLLDGPAEVASEAVFALGLSRERRAFDILVERYGKRAAGGPSTLSWFSAMALTRQEEAGAFLLEVISSGEPEAAAAIEALVAARPSEELRSRIAAAVEQSGSERLRRILARQLAR